MTIRGPGLTKFKFLPTNLNVLVIREKFRVFAQKVATSVLKLNRK